MYIKKTQNTHTIFYQQQNCTYYTQQEEVIQHNSSDTMNGHLKCNSSLMYVG